MIHKTLKFAKKAAAFSILCLLWLSACQMEHYGPKDYPYQVPASNHQELSSIEGLGPKELLPFTGLAGTKWLWGQSLLEFTEESAIFRGIGPEYHYTVTDVTEGEALKGMILGFGPTDMPDTSFTVNADGTELELINYRNNGAGYNAVFVREDPATLVIPEDTVWGTEWNIPVGGGTDGTRFKGTQWIIFFTEKTALNRSANYTNVDAYTFDYENMRGWIYYINDFILRDWDNMYIPDYKDYHHDMVCYRVR
jgi:hypothetical protein